MGGALFMVALEGSAAASDQDKAEMQPAPKLRTDVPYSREPGWRSADEQAHSLGVALADINGDGFPDLVVANGNDLVKHAVTVFYNDKQGHFPEEPSWSSGDLDYHTGVAVGDIDLDGWIDVVVTVGPQVTNIFEQGYTKVYFNRGGTLESTPSYRTEDSYSSFGCALGDYDGDGDLDLAVPVAFEWDGLDSVPGRVRIYENKGGKLSPTPTWQSDARLHATNAKFADIDGDGLLDLAVASRALPIYRARLDERGAITLPTEPWWTARAEFGVPFFLDVGKIGSSVVLVTSYNDYMDVPGDDLVADPPPRHLNYARKAYAEYPREPAPGSCAPGVSGAAPLMAYAPLGSSDPIWISETVGWGAGVRLADVNGDGLSDLLATRWGPMFYGMGAPLEIYLGTSRAFEARPAWVSDTCTIGEAIAVADLDRGALKEVLEPFSIERPQSVVTLSRQNVEAIVEVQRDGRALGLGEYVTLPGGNWISFGRRLQPGERVSVRYAYSTQPDVVLSNTYASNDVFYYQRSPQGRPDTPQAAAAIAGGHASSAEPTRYTGLRGFIEELGRNPELQAAFLEDPEGVIRQQDLSDEEKESLLSRDTRRIEEVRGALDWNGVLLAWGPAPWIPPEARITGPQLSEERRGNVVTVSFHGAFLGEGNRHYELRRGNTVIPGDVSNVQNPDTPWSSVDVTFSLGTDAPTGNYDVYVYERWPSEPLRVRDISVLIKD